MKLRDEKYVQSLQEEILKFEGEKLSLTAALLEAEKKTIFAEQKNKELLLSEEEVVRDKIKAISKKISAHKTEITSIRYYRKNKEKICDKAKKSTQAKKNLGASQQEDIEINEEIVLN